MEQDQQQPNQLNNTVDEYERREDQRKDIIHDGMTIMAEKIADMMGIEDQEEKAKMIEGYRTMMAGPQRMPSLMMSMPTVIPDSTCTTIGPAGEIITMDWTCILSHTYKHTYYPTTKTTKLVTYQGRVIDLDQAQTLHLVRFLDDMNKSKPGMYGNRPPKTFLDHPAIKELLANDGPSDDSAA